MAFHVPPQFSTADGLGLVYLPESPFFRLSLLFFGLFPRVANIVGAMLRIIWAYYMGPALAQNGSKLQQLCAGRRCPIDPYRPHCPIVDVLCIVVMASSVV